jgi:hypothetical protein
MLVTSRVVTASAAISDRSSPISVTDLVSIDVALSRTSIQRFSMLILYAASRAPSAPAITQRVKPTGTSPTFHIST